MDSYDGVICKTNHLPAIRTKLWKQNVWSIICLHFAHMETDDTSQSVFKNPHNEFASWYKNYSFQITDNARPLHFEYQRNLKGVICKTNHLPAIETKPRISHMYCKYHTCRWQIHCAHYCVDNYTELLVLMSMGTEMILHTFCFLSLVSITGQGFVLREVSYLSPLLHIVKLQPEVPCDYRETNSPQRKDQPQRNGSFQVTDDSSLPLGTKTHVVNTTTNGCSTFASPGKMINGSRSLC